MRRWGHRGESREHGHMLTAPAVDEDWGTDTGSRGASALNESTEISGAKDGECRRRERRLSALPSSDGTSPPPGLTAGRERNGAGMPLPPRQPMKEHPVTERIQPDNRSDNQPEAEKTIQPTDLNESAAPSPTEQAPTADASPADPAVEAVEQPTAASSDEPASPASGACPDRAGSGHRGHLRGRHADPGRGSRPGSGACGTCRAGRRPAGGHGRRQVGTRGR